MTRTWSGLHLLNHYMNLSKLGEMVKDREAWPAAVQGVTKNRTWLSDRTAIIIWFPLVSFSQITQRRARGRSLIFTEQRSISLKSLYQLWKKLFFWWETFLGTITMSLTEKEGMMVPKASLDTRFYCTNFSFLWVPYDPLFSGVYLHWKGWRAQRAFQGV